MYKQDVYRMMCVAPLLEMFNAISATYPIPVVGFLKYQCLVASKGILLGGGLFGLDTLHGAGGHVEIFRYGSDRLTSGKC